jgi:hypothetical protein
MGLVLPGLPFSSIARPDEQSQSHEKGRARRPSWIQRVAMYIVISKPKRISVKLGVTHCIEPPLV